MVLVVAAPSLPAASINIQRVVSCRCGTDSQVAMPHLPCRHVIHLAQGCVMSRQWAAGEEKGVGGGVDSYLVSLSGQERKSSPPFFSESVRRGTRRLCLRPQLWVQVPVVPKIKCIKTGRQSLLSDHHDNRHGETTPPLQSSPCPERLHCWTARFLSAGLSRSLSCRLWALSLSFHPPLLLWYVSWELFRLTGSV